MQSPQRFRACSYIKQSFTPSPLQYNIKSVLGTNISQSHSIGKGYMRDIFVEKLPFVTPGPADYGKIDYSVTSPSVAIKERYRMRSELTPAPNEYKPKYALAARDITLKQKPVFDDKNANRSPGPCAYFEGLHDYLHSTGKSFKLGPSGGEIDRTKPRERLMFMTYK